jgi:hypothetical protein
MKLQHTLLAAAVLLTLGGSAQAATTYNRVPASGCLFETDYVGDYVFSYGGISNNSSGVGARARNLHCPLVDPSKIWDIAADGYDANNDPGAGVPTAKICQTQNYGTTVTCTAATPLLGGTSTGPFTTWLPHSLSDGLRNPSYAAWYAELVISLPQQGIYGPSSFYGFFVN